MSPEISIQKESRIRQWLFNLADQTFWKNLAYMGGVQVGARVLRIGATVVIARKLTEIDFGIAAIALASYEVLYLLARTGTIAKLVQVDSSMLVTSQNTAYWVNWLFFTVLALLGVVLAPLVAVAFGQPVLTDLIRLLSISFLVLPFGVVQAAINIRNQRLKYVAQSDFYQMLGEAVLSILLALNGAGYYSLIIPKLVTMPLWVWVHRRSANWLPPKRWEFHRGWEMLRFSGQLWISDCLYTLRRNTNYFLIAWLLGIPAAGVFFFAHNAGLGLAQNLIQALNQCIFPKWCQAERNKKLKFMWRKDMFLAVLLLATACCAQILLLDWYMPIVYGNRWSGEDVVFMVILSSVSAVPVLMLELASTFFRATGNSASDIRVNAWSLFSVLAGVLLGSQWGLTGIAMGLFGSQSILAVILVFLIHKHKR